MQSFKQYLSEARNTHLEHLEDDIINNGYEGGLNAVQFLKSLRDMMVGSSSGRVNVSVKWDGAPAIFCGIKFKSPIAIVKEVNGISFLSDLK